MAIQPGGRQTRGQKETVGRVMHEFKQGALKSHGRPVKNPKQAIAIALHEAGASNQETPEANAKALRRTKKRERAARDETRAELYAKAKARNVPGRSKMTKDELVRALHR